MPDRYEWVSLAFHNYREAQLYRDNEITRYAVGKLKSLSSGSWKRFSKPVLIELLKAGWKEERHASPEYFKRLISEMPAPPPALVREILDEFADLDLGSGRSFSVGEVYPEEVSRHAILQRILGQTLYPIGSTDIYCDDPLVVYADGQGRIFIDGSNGMRETSYLVEYVAASFERALELMLVRGEKQDPWPETGKKGEWIYDFPEP